MGRLLFIPDGGVKAGDDRVEKRDIEFLVEVEELLRLKLRRVRRRCHRHGRHREEDEEEEEEEDEEKD